jgi:hypothetical protein
MKNKLSQMKENLITSVPTNLTGYVGVPAPDILEYDEWFGDPPETERSIQIKESKKLEEEHKNLYLQIKEPEVFVEPDNIHELMYEMATQNANTTLDLDPMLDLTIGGSETYQEGPGGWQSGTGFVRFRDLTE